VKKKDTEFNIKETPLIWRRKNHEKTDLYYVVFKYRVQEEPIYIDKGDRDKVTLSYPTR
jgi:hypothetical protein